MPNWTQNKVTCNKRLANILLTKKDGKYILDFNKLVPMPKELDLPTVGIENEAVACYYLSLNSKDRDYVEKILKKTIEGWCGNYWNRYEETINKYKKDSKSLESAKSNFSGNFDNYNVEFNSLEELGKQYFENIKNYKSSEWYDWRFRNWGTKWNVEEKVDVNVVSDDCYEISFLTAWSSPVGIVIKFSENCKDGELNWEFVNEDYDGYHHLKLEDGKIVDYVTDYQNEYEEDSDNENESSYIN